jgi:hypothetical protein
MPSARPVIPSRHQACEKTQTTEDINIVSSWLVCGQNTLFNHSFRRFLELVQPTTAHVVPEPLFLDTLSIRFHTVSASISEIPTNINLSPPERKWKAYTGGVKEVERKRVKNLSIQRSRRV